jgi:thioesterase domain-containing protein/acyl carrier protein
VSNINTSPTIKVLSQIWQKVLQLPTIDAEDNFFDLGGDSILAVQMFAEIAQVCGRQLPPVMIYHVPTIAALAAVVEQSTQPQFSPLVLLKNGTEEPPVFILPGLGGGPAEFFHLVKYVRFPRAIYGMQPKGMDGLEEPSERIENMAEFYLQAIQQIQHRGPYTLIGYSLGGLVALEMAQRLAASGEKMAMLVMLDSYPHMRYLSADQRIRLIARRTQNRVSAATSLLMGRDGRGPSRGSLDPAQAAAFAPAFERVRSGAFLALQHYRPRFYAGRIKFVRAGILSDFPDDPATIWAGLAAELEVETVPGDHVGMLTTHHRSLGSVLTRYLEEASELI